MSKRKRENYAPCPGCGDMESPTATSLCWRCDVVLYQMAREQKLSRVSLYREITKKGGIEALSILNWKTDGEEDDLRFAEKELMDLRAERQEARRKAMAGVHAFPLVAPKVEFVQESRETPAEEALRLARMNPRRIIPVRKGEGLTGCTLYFEPYLDGRGILRVRQLDQNAKGG